MKEGMFKDWRFEVRARQEEKRIKGGFAEWKKRKKIGGLLQHQL
jgi:hypothetical protein